MPTKQRLQDDRVLGTSAQDKTLKLLEDDDGIKLIDNCGLDTKYLLIENCGPDSMLISN